MDNIAEGYERDGTREFIQFSQLQKHLREKPDHNFIGLLIENIYQRKYSKSCIKKSFK